MDAMADPFDLGDVPAESDREQLEINREHRSKAAAAAEAAEIAAVLAPYRDADPVELLQGSVGQAAALLVAVATGAVKAPLKLRLEAARNIVDRVHGTPVQQIVLQDKRKVDVLLQGLARMEQVARAHVEPLTLIPAMPNVSANDRRGH